MNQHASRVAANIYTSSDDAVAAFYRSSPPEDFHQSYARFEWLKRQGVAAVVAVARQDDAIVGAAVLEQNAGQWYSWKGPVGTQSDRLTMSALLSACATLSPVSFVLQPEWVHRDVLAEANYHEAGAFETLLVPADGTEADILARMKPAARRRVTHGLRGGVQFKEDNAALEPFYEVYAASMRDSGSPDFASYQELATLLALDGVRLFLAYLDGAVVAGSICLSHAHTLEARYVATSAAHRHLGPLNVVHFMSLIRAAAAGKRFLDLSGIATGDDDPKLGNINRFKEGFGGARFAYPVFRRA